MSVTVKNFRSGLSEAQLSWLELNAEEWTDEEIIDRFDNGQPWCDSNFVFGELHRFIDGEPSSGQEFRLNGLVHALCDFAKIPAITVSVDAPWQERRLAETQRFQEYCETHNALISFPELTQAWVDRQSCSRMISRLVKITGRMGIDPAAPINTAQPRSATAATKAAAKKSAPAKKAAPRRRAAGGGEEPF